MESTAIGIYSQTSLMSAGLKKCNLRGALCTQNSRDQRQHCKLAATQEQGGGLQKPGDKSKEHEKNISHSHSIFLVFVNQQRGSHVKKLTLTLSTTRTYSS